MGDRSTQRLFLLRIDLFDSFEKPRLYVVVFRFCDERANIFGKARSALTDARAQKAAADSFVFTDTLRDFFNVGPARFANGRNSIDIRDLQRQK